MKTINTQEDGIQVIKETEKRRVNIWIHEPKDIKNPTVKQHIQTLLAAGYKTFEIGLTLAFQTDKPEAIFNDFRIIKNKVAFERDTSH